MLRFAKMLVVLSLVLPLMLLSKVASADTVSTPSQLYYTNLNTVSGNPNGNVSVVEFFDYNCEYCHLMPAILNGIMRSNPNVRVVFRDYPILGPESTYAARAALAASAQGRYLAFHNALFAHRGVNDNIIAGIAANVGVNMPQFNRDIMSGMVSEQIHSTVEAANQLNLSGVPVVVVAPTPRKGENSVPGIVMVSPTYHELQAAINQAASGS